MFEPNYTKTPFETVPVFTATGKKNPVNNMGSVMQNLMCGGQKDVINALKTIK